MARLGPLEVVLFRPVSSAELLARFSRNMELAFMIMWQSICPTGDEAAALENEAIIEVIGITNCCFKFSCSEDFLLPGGGSPDLALLDLPTWPLECLSLHTWQMRYQEDPPTPPSPQLPAQPPQY